MSILVPGRTTELVQGFAAGFLLRFDWLTLTITTSSVLICLLAALGPWGRLRLGGSDAKPEFATRSWLAMLFAAGMGSGIVFWGAAEPLIFAISPPPGGADPGTAEAIRDSYALTMFHWAIHAWAIYAVSALAIGYTAYAKNAAPLPSVPFGNLRPAVRRTIDWAAVLAVTFGVVASLGQSVINMGAGAELILGRNIDGVSTQITILFVLLFVYLYSAWRGLKGGIQPLSNFNMGLALLLVAFVLVAGPTIKLIEAVFSMARAYGTQFLQLSTDLRPDGEPRQWTRFWSLTYFLWWIAWTPFVGVFIARISKGRSIREFITGVVLVPSLVTLFWFGIFGGAALDMQLAGGIDLGVADFRAAPAATYKLMEHLPLTLLMQCLTLLLVFVFLVTSADSGAYVLAMFSSRRAGSPPRMERMFWGVILAVLTIGAIMSAAGQNATRALAVVGSIPLAFLIVGQVGAAMVKIWQDWRQLNSE